MSSPTTATTSDRRDLTTAAGWHPRHPTAHTAPRRRYRRRRTLLPLLAALVLLLAACDDGDGEPADEPDPEGADVEDTDEPDDGAVEDDGDADDVEVEVDDTAALKAAFRAYRDVLDDAQRDPDDADARDALADVATDGHAAAVADELDELADARHQARGGTAEIEVLDVADDGDVVSVEVCVNDYGYAVLNEDGMAEDEVGDGQHVRHTVEFADQDGDLLVADEAATDEPCVPQETVDELEAVIEEVAELYGTVQDQPDASDTSLVDDSDAVAGEVADDLRERIIAVDMQGETSQPSYWDYDTNLEVDAVVDHGQAAHARFCSSNQTGEDWTLVDEAGNERVIFSDGAYTFLESEFRRDAEGQWHLAVQETAGGSGADGSDPVCEPFHDP